MMNKMNLPHLITVTSFVVFIVLGLACATTEPNQSGTQRRLYSAEDYTDRAGVHLDNKRYDLAIDDCNEAIRLSPKNSLAYFVRAYAYSGKGDYDLAINDYTEVIRLSPPNPAPVYNARAWTYAYYMKTNFDQAIADATQAIRLERNEANYYDTRGWAYLGKGDYNRANDDFIKALQLDRNLESSREGLGKIREAQAEEVIDWSEFE